MGLSEPVYGDETNTINPLWHIGVYGFLCSVCTASNERYNESKGF